MPTSVTVEGSMRPCDVLARGERRTVFLDAKWQKLIDRGFVVVVDEFVDLVPADELTDMEREADEQAGLARAETEVIEEKASDRLYGAEVVEHYREKPRRKPKPEPVADE